jgi:LPXTG-site transpeptidase (sortase) family protein
MLLAVPSSLALDPPNQNDPCSNAGRNTCGTLGVGYYKEYRYGIRWFGDYRGAVAGIAHTFCIDLGYWYPKREYRYARQAKPLKSRNGRSIGAEAQAKMNYAAWRFGQSTNRDQQAAVMLYVHSLMADGRPGEVDPKALGPHVAGLYERIATAAERFHGPYLVSAEIPGGLVVGKPASGTVRVVSATGEPMAGVEVALTAKGVSDVPGVVRTNAAGVARFPLTPVAVTGSRIAVRTEALPSGTPRVYAPTIGLAVRNGQRLIAASAQAVAAVATAPAARTRVAVTTVAVPSTLAIGEESRDRVTIAGPLATWHGTISVRIHGPFPTISAIRCNGVPVATSTVSAVGPGVVTTQPATLQEVGWYTYEEVIPPDSTQIGTKTACGVPSENFRVETQPRIRTIVASDRVQPGSPLSDRVFVEGLAGQSATVHAELYGPFPAREAITCSGTPIWTDSFPVHEEGEYRTAPFMVKMPGFYAYRETIEAHGFVRSTETACADTAETTVVVATPTIRTRVNRPETRPGETVADHVTVSGLGPVSVHVQAVLWGPFPSRSSIHCSGSPYWTGSFEATGTGTYTTGPVKLEKAGYYAFQETIPAGPANEAFTATCPDVAETTVARASPTVSTIASNEVVRPGAAIFDHIRVYGLGETAAAIDVQLFGPFPSRAAVRCSMPPYWNGRVYAKGSGTLQSPSVKVPKAGFYAWRESIVGSPLVEAHTMDCGLAVEMSLARPLVVTGRGDVATHVTAPGAGPLTPTRVRISGLDIDAAVFPSVIDVAHGVLGVPDDIDRLGWWRDGSAPGAAHGSILIAGHVDSAKGGAGAFFRLDKAKRGDRIEVETAGGRTFGYRIVSVRKYPKSDLPADVYSVRGDPRLVLVTCGGRFDHASGHYLDNIVVTALPG